MRYLAKNLGFVFLGVSLHRHAMAEHYLANCFMLASIVIWMILYLTKKG
jgi:hypothetical protein